MVRSLERNRFLASCCEIVEPPCTTPPARALVASARKAGGIDTEVFVKPAVFGRQRRLDQVVRIVFQRDGVVVPDAARADLVAETVKEGDGEFRLLQPVVVGRFP